MFHIEGNVLVPNADLRSKHIVKHSCSDSPSRGHIKFKGQSIAVDGYIFVELIQGRLHTNFQPWYLDFSKSIRVKLDSEVKLRWVLRML